MRRLLGSSHCSVVCCSSVCKDRPVSSPGRSNTVQMSLPKARRDGWDEAEEHNIQSRNPCDAQCCQVTANCTARCLPVQLLPVPTSASSTNFPISTQKGTFIPCGPTQPVSNSDVLLASCRNAVSGSRVATQPRGRMLWLNVACSYHSEPSPEGMEAFPLTPFCHLGGHSCLCTAQSGCFSGAIFNVAATGPSPPPSKAEQSPAMPAQRS